MKFIYLSLIAFAILISSNQKTVSNVSFNLGLTDSTEYCLVDGGKIEGQGVKYSYLNTDVKFCCEACEKTFKKNPAKHLKGAGLRCPVCDEDDAKTNLSTVSNGVKYYFCGKGCKNKFKKDPETYLKRYQK